MSLKKEQKIKFWLVTISKILFIILVVYKLISFSLESKKRKNLEKANDAYARIDGIFKDLMRNYNNILDIHGSLENNKTYIEFSRENLESRNEYRKELIRNLKEFEKTITDIRNTTWRPEFKKIMLEQEEKLQSEISKFQNYQEKNNIDIRNEKESLRKLLVINDSLEYRWANFDGFSQLELNTKKLFTEIESDKLQITLDKIKKWKKGLEKDIDFIYEENTQNIDHEFLEIITVEFEKAVRRLYVNN